MHSSSLLPGVDSLSTIHPTTHATSEIMRGISEGSYSKVASGSYRLASLGSTSLNSPGFSSGGGFGDDW